MTISVEIEFNAAHRILNHPAECRFIHGHRYRVIVELVGDINNDTDMVKDFRDVKKVLMTRIHDEYDHSIILKQDDPLVNGIKELIPDQKMILLKTHPTCEQIAKDISSRLRDLGLKSVIVYETPTMSSRVEDEEI